MSLGLTSQTFKTHLLQNDTFYNIMIAFIRHDKQYNTYNM